MITAVYLAVRAALSTPPDTDPPARHESRFANHPPRWPSRTDTEETTA